MNDDEIYVYVYDFLWGLYSVQIKVKMLTKNGKYNKLQQKQFCKKGVSSVKEGVFLSGLLL